MKLFKLLLLISLINAVAISDTTKCLFVGNSYTDVNNLPLLFKQLSASGGKIVYTEMSAPGGYTLEGHTQLQTTLDKINSRTWSYVILQEQSQYPVIPYYRNNSTVPNARKLDSLIKLRGSSTMFYMTWGRKYGGIQCINSYCSANFTNYFHMQDSLTAAYNMVSSLLNAQLAPVGSAWKRARSIDTTVELFDPDNSHPSLRGSYLAACVFYAKIFGISPVGLTYIAGLPQNEALWLQQIAADVVLGVSNNGVNIPYEYNIHQNYPNPFNPETRMTFSLPVNGFTEIVIFNSCGQKIMMPVNEVLDAGNYILNINFSNYSSGIYFCRFRSGNFFRTIKMVYIR